MGDTNPITLVCDYETFFTSDYSLSNMTTREYILDERFEIIGASLSFNYEKAKWYDLPELEEKFRELDWSRVHFVAHNCMFDGAITQWRMGYRPRMWYDTMGMAQAILAPTAGGAALKKVAKFVGRQKDSAALMNMRGVRAGDIDKQSAEWARYVAYANEDSNTCAALFGMLKIMMPKKELLIIDTLLRMYFDNRLMIDGSVIEVALQKIREESEAALRAAGVADKKVLRSRDSFASLLRSHGVTPPTKVSPTTGETTYAFAKNDLEFTKLLEHDNPAVVALVEAKLNASSSIEETRAARFQRLANIGGGVLNVPLRYSAAHTHRFGGSDKLNLQNLPRNSPLRDAIVTPEGHSLVVVDSSQIEARMLAWLAGCTVLTQAFARGDDVYSAFASTVYGYTVNKKDNPEERFVGKTGILGLGFGTGWKKLQWSLLTSPFYDGEASEEFAKKLVDTYRGTYTEIPQFWKRMDYALQCMANGHAYEYGPIQFERCRLRLPSGLYIQYPELHYEEGTDWHDSGYVYWSARYNGWKKIYGAALTENIVQALARIVITDTMLMMRATNPEYFCALQVHDELGYLVPDGMAERCYHDMMKYMTTPPSWAPGLPLAAEGGWGKRYSDVK